MRMFLVKVFKLGLTTLMMLFLLNCSHTQEKNPILEMVPALGYMDKGQECSKKGQYDEAIEYYTKAIDTGKLETKVMSIAYYSRGYCYFNKKQYDRAIEDFSEAIKLNPKLAEAYNNRAFIYAHTGEYDKSWKDVYKAQDLGHKVDPEFLKALRKASGRER